MTISEMRCPICNYHLDIIPILLANSFDKYFTCINNSCYSIKNDIKQSCLVRDDWWFLSSYNLCFMYNNELYNISGPDLNYDNLNDEDEKTYLHRIYFINQNGARIAMYDDAVKLPYIALPNNNDFNNEFEKLKERIMTKLLLLA